MNERPNQGRWSARAVFAGVVVLTAFLIGPPAAAHPLPEPPPGGQPGPKADLFRLMDAHLAGKQDAEPTLWSFDRLAALAQHPVGEVVKVASSAKVTDIDLRALSKRASRIHLGPGVYRVTGAFDRERDHVELVGAGPTKTFVRTPDQTVLIVRTKGRVTAWMRDLTFEGDILGDGANGRIVDARGPCVALFERVRFRAWDDRAGYGAPLGVSRDGRLLAALRRCSFVGGYKRRMGGEALAVHGSTLHLFDRCRFHDMDASFSESDIAGASTRSRGLFLRCRFENTPLSRSSTAPVTGRRGRYPVHVRGGEALVGRAGDTEQGRRKRWNESRALTVVDVDFSMAPVRATVGELREVTQRYRALDDERVIGVEVVTWHECPKPFYVVHAVDAQGGARRHVVERKAGGVRPFVLPHEPVRHPLPARPAPGPTLLSLLEASWARLDLEASVHSVAIHQTTRGNAVLQVNDRLN